MEEKIKKFTEILAEFQHKIYRLCHSFIKNDEDKKDVFNTILLRIWKGLDSFTGKSSISTWIYRITVNSCIDFIRSEKKRKLRSWGGAIADMELLAGSADVERDFMVSVEIADLYTCIESLTLLDKTIISLFLEDLSYEEIAEVIGITTNHVGVKIHRIKKEINICLQEKKK